MAAVIGIRDAAEADFEQAGKAGAFNGSTMANEFYLESDATLGVDRDPLAGQQSISGFAEFACASSNPSGHAGVQDVAV